MTDKQSRRAACLKFAPRLDEFVDETRLPPKTPRKFLRHGDITLKKPPRIELRPRLHDRYWNSGGKGGHKLLSEIVAQLYPDGAADQDDELAAAEFTLEQAKAIAQTAYDRAEIVERRATTIAGSVSIATPFTVSGATFIMGQTWLSGPVTTILAVLLAFVTVFFVLSAGYSLRGLAGAYTRTWSWESPWLLNREIVDRPLVERTIYRSADLLDDFAYNWERADLKKRFVDNAVLCLTLAMLGIGILSAVVVYAILCKTGAYYGAY